MFTIDNRLKILRNIFLHKVSCAMYTVVHRNNIIHHIRDYLVAICLAVDVMS